MWLIVLKFFRFVLKNHSSGEETILHLTPEQEKDKTHFTDKNVSRNLYSVKYSIKLMVVISIYF